ncbi:predicted protein [Naegleria gruberi]|uniref:Predicted protein n=1 Tax=Naegleria gruberi TaxID=5762 RepID=D2VND1_NAEGR|nr:uncharacterized protein NAEGRDRAFT_70453 [Naegleria gruberi]EFC41716.1 predicted protein [Naegleria gruberi]|eukprot:XP_002674460.1 predicted protein [Naegleria gruberi strain NEG-M]
MQRLLSSGSSLRKTHTISSSPSSTLLILARNGVTRSFHISTQLNSKVPIIQHQQQTKADDSTVDVKSLITPPKNQEPVPNNYILLYRNPKARFFKFAFIASMINAVTLSLLAYFTMTMVKLDEHGNKEEASLTTKILIGLGYGLAAVGVIAGIAYYARHNILEFGLIDEKTLRIVTAKFGWGNYKDTIVPVDHINIPQNSMENLKYNLFLTEDVASKVSENSMKHLKRKGDYIFVGIKGKKWNHLMDITAEAAYVDKHNFMRFLEHNPRIVASSIPRAGKGFNPYKN